MTYYKERKFNVFILNSIPSRRAVVSKSVQRNITASCLRFVLILRKKKS